MADAIDAPERRFVQNKYGKASVVSNLTWWDQIVFEVSLHCLDSRVVTRCYKNVSNFLVFYSLNLVKTKVKFFTLSNISQWIHDRQESFDPCWKPENKLSG